jgi:hypothetical protein
MRQIRFRAIDPNTLEVVTFYTDGTERRNGSLSQLRRHLDAFKQAREKQTA